MISFPNAKINLGLNIVERRTDGFHNIETIFYPIYKLCDILEITPSKEQSQSVVFKQTGIIIDEPDENNLCVKAYNLLKTYADLPKVSIHLHKQIPFGAGLGGGSADGAFTLAMLNCFANNPIPKEKLLEVALKLGSDCPFFLYNKPCFAKGRGELINPISLDLSGLYILLVNPSLHVNTGKAYSLSKSKHPEYKLESIIFSNLNEWKNIVINDFENIVFSIHPEIGEIKDKLYQMGAIYASMSGSGSTVFGIFKDKPEDKSQFYKYFTHQQIL